MPEAKIIKMLINRVSLTLFFCLFSATCFAAGSNPAIVFVNPSAGISNINQIVSLTAAFSDNDGYQDIQDAKLLINIQASGSNCFYGYYKQSTNQIFLRNSADTAWLGGFAPGSDRIIESDYAKLYCGQTSVSAQGKNLTINWSIAFKHPFTGQKGIYLYVKDASGAYKGWSKLGTWVILPNYRPSAGDIMPDHGSIAVDAPSKFTTTFNDANGWEDIQNAHFQINTDPLNATKCFYGYYKHDTNTLYLRNDANTGWLGGYAPGSNNTIENYCAKLNCANTVVSGKGTVLTINWSITPKLAFAGTKNMYLYVQDISGLWNPWTNKGQVTITPPADTTAPSGSIKINNDSPYTNSPDVALNLSAQDNPGGSGISQMQFSNDKQLWSAPENYAVTKNWTLTSRNGEKTVYARYKDAAGNWSQPCWDTITLDITPPVISLKPVLSPRNQAVTFSYSASDNFTPADKIVITGDGSPYTAEGAYNVTLSAKDLAGNVSSYPIGFVIDKTPPAIVINSPVNGAVVEDTQIQISGTVDGKTFSESRALNEGENTLIVNKVDAAGNTAQVSVTVYLYMGELIGPEGGEITSQDGKIKLVIPQGALAAPARIRISKINTDTLKEATPSGKSLLSVVECKPYGIVFNQPVSLIYTLPQAEIPGTPVELGLFDAVQDKIISTGQTATVPTDGYTVSFSLVHFSTYAALKSLTPQSTPIGTGVKIPLPDLLTGAFGHAIPISVPAGRKGIQPGLGLSYRSSGGNSWVGMGFSLNPGYIVRSTRLGPPKYNDTQDTFYYITDGGITELVHLIDNLYQAKVESSFTKFFKESDDSWRVVGKDGGVIRFGQTADSRETSGSGTFSWYMNRVVDTNGNYIEYSYIKDQGKCYLSRIDYTGNETMGVSPANSVELFCEDRDDVASSYISSSRIATAKRLKEIQAKVNGELVWRYALEYAYSPDSGRSLLKSVKQFAADNKMLPEQKLSYQEAKQ